MRYWISQEIEVIIIKAKKQEDLRHLRMFYNEFKKMDISLFRLNYENKKELLHMPLYIILIVLWN